MSETNEKASYLWRLGRWMAELVLVFVGVYAAFWLNNYQQHREQIQRRDQILAYLEQRLQDGIDSAKTDGANEERQVAEFQRALATGEMPPLRPFAFFSDPATKKLRKRFEKYPEGLNATVKLFHDMEKTQTDLLKQVQAERKRH